MRCTLRPIVGVLMVATLGSGGIGQETKAPWWHFGRDKELSNAPLAETQSAGVAQAPTMTPAPPLSPEVTPVEDQSWLHWPKLPKVTWFETSEETIVTDPFASPPATKQSRSAQSQYGKVPHRTRPRNTWAQRPASSTTVEEKPSAWQTMTDRTKNAWHKTVDWVTPGDSATEAPVVAAQTRPSWWARMWGAEEVPQGPQTVTEWMAQDRIDP